MKNPQTLLPIFCLNSENRCKQNRRGTVICQGTNQSHVAQKCNSLVGVIHKFLQPDKNPCVPFFEWMVCTWECCGSLNRTEPAYHDTDEIKGKQTGTVFIDHIEYLPSMSHNKPLFLLVLNQMRTKTINKCWHS